MMDKTCEHCHLYPNDCGITVPPECLGARANRLLTGEELANAEMEYAKQFHYWFPLHGEARDNCIQLAQDAKTARIISEGILRKFAKLSVGADFEGRDRVRYWQLSETAWQSFVNEILKGVRQ